MISRPPVLITAPAALPVALVEAKKHLRVDHDDEDNLITAYIEAATAHLDGYSGVLGRALINQGWRQDFDGFCRILRLPLPNVSAAAVTYDDASGAEQTVDSGTFRILSDHLSAYVAASLDTVWPSARVDAGSVRVTFTAGYGEAAEDVPAPIRSAILLMIGDLYENRATVSERGSGRIDMSTTVERLITPYRRMTI
ncbi:head-tail connector protein [Aurantimonas sp. A2-1-M11]|uniref:head-tail connector protein n=1 Tax=Aurantimonas sp. A2-1-M11 TaxID=3113712 RepID=UPI002F94A041